MVKYTNALGVNLDLSAASQNWNSSSSIGGTLTGTRVNDTLRAYFGTYTFAGGAGDDVYFLASKNDVVLENAGQGIDTVHAFFPYTLAANVENLVLLGSNSWFGSGNDLDNIIIGNAYGQQIDGGKGNDVLVGGGGADTFIVTKGNGSDVIFDFEPGVSKIRLTNYGLTSFEQVRSIAKQIGSNTVLNFANGEKLVLNHVELADLSAGDFQLDHDTSGLKLTFGDDFDSLSLYSQGGTWRTVYNVDDANPLNGRSLNTENQIYVEQGFTGTSDHDLGVNPFSIDNGVLTITAAPTAADVLPYVDDHSYTSGLITSKFTFSQEYGYFEIRAKMPEGQGFWPAFWMLPTDNSWPPELDIFEQLGKDPDTVYMTTHFTSDSAKNDQTQDKLHVDTTQWHTYGVDWGPDTITFYVDGVAVAKQPTPEAMHGEMYFLANLAVGSAWAGRPDETTGTGEMQIDYIRAYATADTVSSTVNGVHTIYSGDGPNASYTQVHGTSGADKLIASQTLQELWGYDGNDTLNSGSVKTILHGGKGNDVYYINGDYQVAIEEAGEGTDSVVSRVSYTLGSNFETLVLNAEVGSINGTGNNFGNRITGNSAANIINGKGGNDMLTGGGGADTFVIEAGNGSDVISDFELGRDRVILDGYGLTSFSQVKAAVTQVGANAVLTFANGEKLTLSGVNASKLSASDFTFDTDPAPAPAPTPTPTPTPAPATAEKSSSVASDVDTIVGYVLPDTVQNYSLSSKDKNVTGNGLNNRIIGNAGDNVIIGGKGNDQLDGGTAGHDTLIGGAGDDLYIVKHAGVTVTEKAGEGTDAVYASISYTLSANVENLTLVGSANINGTGNELANRIAGNAGNNTLVGGAGDDTLDGGTGGQDTLIGGAGNDLYIVKHIGVSVTEQAGEGTDAVYASISYTLSANVENLTLAGSANINGTGNELANRIAGNAGNNTLVGGAGDDTLDGGTGGHDTLIGGAGNDLYIVKHVGVSVTEQAGEGTDAVSASINYTLGANVENLTLGGDLAISGTGNELGNRITGNRAANVINGKGGDDMLIGGGGADSFVFEQGFGSDVITDFSTKLDTLHFVGLSKASMHLSQVGNNVVIDFGGSDSVTLLNVSAKDPALLNHVTFY